jgi:invasion protein IalB
MIMMKVAGLLLLLCTLNLAVAAEEPNARTVTETFQDWQVICTEKDGESQCVARQQLLNQNRQTVIMLSLAKVGDDKMLLQIALPHMLDLTKQVGIGIDGQKSRLYPYQFCNASACFVQVPDSDPLFGLFKKGTSGTLQSTLMGEGKQLSFPFSLKGFSAALERLK